jgi:hypothetical protein
LLTLTHWLKQKTAPKDGLAAGHSFLNLRPGPSLLVIRRSLSI